MHSPLAFIDSLRIGSVDFVSPDEIKVILDIEAPNNIALNTGFPRPFPRINSYVIIPSENGFIVAQVEWITIERSQYPKRKGMQDFGVIDLPFPLRKMSLNPLGVLKATISKDELEYVFSRGVEIFPTVGDPVLLPSQEQLKSIVESGSNRRVKIGTSPLASNADVSVDPDRLFGRHLAVLGNTGSGKSCSVAGLIRWSVEASQAKKSSSSTGSLSNSRFIILDPNGEYAEAFKDFENVQLFGVEADESKNVKQLQVPLWFWNTDEWCAIAQASSKAQRPTLIQALRTVRERDFDFGNIAPIHRMRSYLRTVKSILSAERTKGNPWGEFPKNKNFHLKLEKWRKAFSEDEIYSEQQNQAISDLYEYIDELLNARTGNHPHYDYTLSEIDELFSLVSSAHTAFGGSDRDYLPIGADTPRKFSGNDLLRSIEANAELMNTSEYVETMTMRIHTVLSDSRMSKIISGDNDLTLEKWLEDYICPNSNGESRGAITVIDLSLVPAEVVHVVTAVIARITLEALQRYRLLNDGIVLPTTIVMEEAHIFIKRYVDDYEDSIASSICSKVFEKIAREGRKFGLGLVLSSQRPSELSPTVLSQCNTFLLHRISNDRDQELVNRLVPDNLRGLLRELPSLPSQRAILLGWASELPVMVHMNYLSKEHRPQSNDPAFWDAWTNKDSSIARGWEEVARNWQEYD